MKLSVTTLFNEAWDSIKNQLALVAGLTLVFFLGTAAVAMIPIIGGFLGTPFLAGYMHCLLQIRRKKEIGYQDFFWGFTDLNRLANLLILGLLAGFLTFLGCLFFVVPGIWFFVAGSLSTAYLVLHNEDAIMALKQSLAGTKGRWWNQAKLLIFAGLLTAAGAMCFVLGILLTTPIAALMLILAAKSLEPKTAMPLEIPGNEIAPRNFDEEEPGLTSKP